MTNAIAIKAGRGAAVRGHPIAAHSGSTISTTKPAKAGKMKHSANPS